MKSHPFFMSCFLEYPSHSLKNFLNIGTFRGNGHILDSKVFDSVNPLGEKKSF